MASLYKRYRIVVNKETGQKERREQSSWWGRFRDALGIERRMSLSPNRKIAERKLKDITDRIMLEKSGLIPPAEKEMKRHLREHIADFEKHHAANENSEQHVVEIVKKVKAFVEFCGWQTPSQIREHDVETFLYDLRKVRGRSIQTSNNYLRAIKNFTRWMVRNKRMTSNPIEGLSMLNVRTDRRHDRRPLDDYELKLLIEAAESGPPAESAELRLRQKLLNLIALLSRAFLLMATLAWQNRPTAKHCSNEY